MSKSTDHQESIPRRDFLATSSLFTLGTIFGLTSKTSLGNNNPLMIAPKDATIEKLAIYPPIGISRVGNSKKYFLAPEIPGLVPNPIGGFKDGNQKIKKQAQRFRIYAFDKKGRVIKEITEGNDTITWSVKVANTKAAWFSFNNPLDMGKLAPGLPGKRRNDFFVGKEREVLEVSPDEVSISGISINKDGLDKRFIMDDTFWKGSNQKNVSLGDVRTDNKGRLIVMPSDGVSDSAMKQNPIDNFADNDGWYDDWADGYVKAKVTLANGTTLDVEPSWIACCGPDFAPEVPPFITMHDVVRDVMINGKKKPLEKKPVGKLSFKEEIYPFFKRLGLLEWTSAAANLREGWINTSDFLNEDFIKQLADPSSVNQALRTKVFSQFRSPDDYKFYDKESDYDEKIKYKIPFMLGSGVNYDFSPAHWFTMPDLQYWILEQWNNGNFINDYDIKLKVDETQKFEDIPLDQQPMALTRSALEPLSGGAFHPGVELTWPLRQQAIFSDTEPYRIKVGNREHLYKQVEDLGLLLTPEAVFEGAERSKSRSGESYSYYNLPKNSPIGPQNPGDLTRWLGLPWQPDAFSCQMVLYDNDFPNATWWPALLPINVLPEYAYKQLQRDDLDDESKLKFFNDRVTWTRGVSGIGYHVEGSYMDGLKRMIALWSHMGFVTKHPRPENLSPFLKKIIPNEIFVETGRGSMDLLTNDQPNRGLEPK